VSSKLYQNIQDFSSQYGSHSNFTHSSQSVHREWPQYSHSLHFRLVGIMVLSMHWQQCSYSTKTMGGLNVLSGFAVEFISGCWFWVAPIFSEFGAVEGTSCEGDGSED
jgi:hypothetical protein